MINTTGINFINKTITKPSNEAASKNKTEQLTPEEIKKSSITSEYAIAAFGIHKSPSFGGKQKNSETKQFINNLSFADKLSPEDKRALGNVLQKKGTETDYINKMVNLINGQKVNPYALSHLCQNSEMSDLVKGDIDIYTDKVEGQKMSVEDAFVPIHSSKKEGQKATNVGDVFRVKGQDKIYVKSGDDYSRQLEMDAKTYIKLFPPIERYASAQGAAGDCYLLSSINSIMENPYSRAVIYDCFTQKGDSVTAQLYEGKLKIDFPDCKLPEGADSEKYAAGAAGIKILEHMYGKEFENQKYNEYNSVMEEEIGKLNEKLKKLQNSEEQNDSTIKKQNNMLKKIDKYQQEQKKVQEAFKDPNHKLTFVLDDNDDFIMGKTGPLTENCDKLHSAYTYPSDFYRGSNGGNADTALEKIGFFADRYYVDGDEEEEYLDEALFSEDINEYIITAHTAAAGEEVESAVAEDDSIYSSHEYKISPFDDENGNRKFKVTNPWNQSQQVIMDEDKLKEYFTEFAVASVK